MEPTKKCPYCGEEILAVAKKCKHCGEWVDKGVDSASHTEPQPAQPAQMIMPKRKGISKGVIVAILVLLALVIGGLLMIPGRQSKEDSIAQAIKEDPVINFAEPEENEDGMAYHRKESEQPTPKNEKREDDIEEVVADTAAIDNYGSEKYLSRGESYEKGIGFEENQETAFYYYQKAAETGDPAALNKMGNMYAQGKGCAKNMSKAASYYLAAAEKGNKYAQHNIAFCYWDGVGIEKNREKAVMWMRRSAAQGYEKAKKALKTMGVE